jgi:hypothetical protein
MNSPWGFEWDSYDDEELDDEAECPDGDDDEPTTEAGLSPPVKPTTPLDADGSTSHRRMAGVLWPEWERLEDSSSPSRRPVSVFPRHVMS